ncbi:MAG: HAD-IC family P-type ATPase [Anaerolineae bacterium]
MATFPAVSSAPPRGLTEQEAVARREQGQGNQTRAQTSRTYRDIFVRNLLDPINLILFAIGALMVAIGRVSDAVFSVGLIVFNVVVSVVQEIRAKRQLDHIALLTRPTIAVLRDGAEKNVDPSELVKGDVIILRPGDQIVVDGPIVGEGRVEVDESLLTGESDLVVKVAGDEVLSGSFCVTGSARMEAQRVGEEAYANKLTAQARKFVVAQTPLQREIQVLLRIIVLVAFLIGICVLISTMLSQVPFMRQVQMAAIIAGLIPNGLLFMIVLAYALGALRIVRQGALVQQTNAVESLSNVTVLCTDKTGTLTANRIQFSDLTPVGISREEALTLLGDMVHSATAVNKTSEALLALETGKQRKLTDEVPFSSARKWSAVGFGDPDRHGVYVLGAPEMLSGVAALDDTQRAQVQTWANEGLRVLLLAGNTDVTTLQESGEPILPTLNLLALVAFRDELRPKLKETIESFQRNGVALKIISGDNPQTVLALARQAGILTEMKAISGLELEKLSPPEFAQAAAENTIFGRITPQQKEMLVDALRERGHYVAMIGDGVNDVLSLKKADMGVAMQSGSAATRAVADMILLDDSFGALPSAFTEGQRIVNGMKDILRLFLTRVSVQAMMIIAVAILGLGFPFLPKQNTVLVFLTVGIPVFALALWARPGPLPRGSIIKEVGHFVGPAALFVTGFALAVYAGTFIMEALHVVTFNVTPDMVANFEHFAGLTYDIAGADALRLELTQITAQSALTTFLVFVGLGLIPFVEPPTQWFVGGDELSGDWRPSLMAFGLLVVYIIILAVEPFRNWVELVPLPFVAYVGLGAMALLSLLILRLAWRKRWLERYLGLG